MLLIDESPSKVLSVFFSSTDRKFYTSEVVQMSGLSWPTVLAILNCLSQAAVVIREKENNGQYGTGGNARVYYSLSPEIVSVMRVSPPDQTP